MSTLQHHLLALALIGITTLLLGIFILLRSYQKNKIFAFYLFSLAWWSLWEISTQLVSEKSSALFRFHMEYFGICFIPTLFYHGVVSLAGLQRRFEIIASYIASLVFVLLIAVLWHPLVFLDVIPVAHLRYWPKAGPLYIFWVSFFLVVIARTLQTLFTLSRSVSLSLMRTELRLLLLASLFAYIGGVPELVLKYGIRIPILQPYGLYLVSAHTIIIAYAIVQFRLFDIHIAIRRSLVYSVLITLLTVGYFGVIYGAERTFQTTIGYQSFWLSLAAFALMALAFQPLKIWVQRLVDAFFFQTPYEELATRIERLEQETQQTEKLKAVATLAAGMAHEIKNPLASIKTFVEYLPEKHNDQEFLTKFHRIVGQELAKIQTTVQDLLSFAKPEKIHLETVSVGELVQETLTLLNGDCVKRQINVEMDINPSLLVQGDRTRLKQALLNLCLNSLDAMEAGGRISVATMQVDGHLILSIKDTGKGIARQNLPRIFDPFFTTKPTGTGLGLSVVHGIIREHGGKIDVSSSLGQGTTMHIQLPIKPTFQ